LLNPDTITFATINLFNYAQPPNAYYEFENILTQDEWHKKQSWFNEKINQLNPDVIGFQEVFSPDALEKQLNQLGYPYFCTVDIPKADDGYLYYSSVVAIASRYPIVQCQAVGVDSDFMARFEMSSDFSFNRIPVHASIELPHLGVTDCYVVHFKSQRPKEPIESAITSNAAPLAYEKKLLNSLHDEQFGSWLSTLQRGLEANLLHQYITTQRQKTHQAIVLMGDFNKPLMSDEFIGLLSNELRQEKSSQQWLTPFQLKDSWDMYNQLKASDCLNKRPATHYYGAKGSVLDYILLSNEFDSHHSASLLEIVEYNVIDQHLINPSFKHDQFSTDHALVSITAQIRDA
jgi:endonuclease/exonuclease/phosphatase family metal-dependent hydrolase